MSRQAIAGAALELIRTDGLAGITMRAVARRLSIQAPSLYEHVSGKDDLLDLVVQEAFDDFEANIADYERVESIGDWLESVKEGSLALRAFYLRHPGLAGLMVRKLSPHRDRLGGSRAALVRAQLDSLVRLGIDERRGRPLFDATALWSLSAIAAEGVIETDVSESERESRYRRGLTLMLDGLRSALHAAVEESAAAT